MSITRAQEILANASHIEVFTGAGMSADSGIATYRDAQTGLWENVDPQDTVSYTHLTLPTIYAV